MHNKKIFFLLMLVVPTCLMAQKKGAALTDSLLTLLTTVKEDSNKSTLLYKIGVAYSSFDLSKTMMYANRGLLQTQKIKWNKGEGAFYHLIGSVHMNNGAYDSAVVYYNKSYELDKKLKDEHGQVADLINLGLTEATRGDGITAMDYLTRALPLAEKVKDTIYLSLIHNNISNIHFFNKNYTAAKDFIKNALKLARISKDDDAIASSLGTLATIFHEEADTANAMKYYYEALTIYLKNKNKQKEATLLGNIGILKKSKFEAIELKLKAKAIWDALSPNFTDAIKNTGNLGIDYLDLANDTIGKYTSTKELYKNKSLWLLNAEKYLKTAVSLSSETSNVEWYWMYTGNLSTLYKSKGDYKNALYFLEQSIKVNDSIYSQENKNKIAALENRTQIEIKNKEIELKDLALQNERRQRVAMGMGLLLLLVIGILLLRLNKIKQKTNNHLTVLNKELDFANKLKATFFAIISHDFRAPLANMVSYLNVMDDDPNQMSSEDSRRFQKNIKTSAETLLYNMDDVLLWSKGQMNNFKPDIKNIFASKIFTYLENVFDGEKDIEIKYSDFDNVMLLTDENYLQTIMQNLTANAIKSSRNTGNPVIHWVAEKLNNKTVFTITDNGVGIKKEQCKALFEEAIEHNGKTGFGLHLIRDLAKAINCTITVENNVTGGTRFTLQF